MNFFTSAVVFLIASVLVISAIDTAIPACIQDKIQKISAAAVWNPPASISKYSYHGQPTYLISSDCCDQFITLHSESCKYICAPSGGFTGRGDGRCKDFDETAQLLGEVWKDTRSYGKN